MKSDRDEDLNFHDRFQNDRLRALRGLLKRDGSRDLERRLRRVDFMERTVVERHLDVDHRIAGNEHLYQAIP